MRRLLLVLGGAGLVASLPTRVSASDGSYEVEGEAYAGQSHGEWTCGPRAVARYGGVGARARLSERPATAEEGSGFYGTLGAVGEYEAVETIGGPPNNLMFGGGVTLGYRDLYGGLSLGMLAYQSYDSVSSRTPDWSWFPAFEVDFGKQRGFSWRLGFGAPLVSTYRRPAIVFTGPRYVSQAWKLELLAGFYRSGPASLDSAQWRIDTAMQFRMSETLWLGPHAAIAEGRPIDGEGGLRLGLGF